MSALAIDLARLLENIPRGAWVAISSDPDSPHVLAYGAEMKEVLQQARDTRDQSPIMLRLPETQIALML